MVSAGSRRVVIAACFGAPCAGGNAGLTPAVCVGGVVSRIARRFDNLAVAIENQNASVPGFMLAISSAHWPAAVRPETPG